MPIYVLAVSRTVNRRARLEHHRPYTEKVIRRAHEVPRSFVLRWLFARSPASRSVVCGGLSGIVTNERTFRWIRRFRDDRITLLEVGLSRRPSAWSVLTVGRGHLSTTASRPRKIFRSCALSRLEGSAERAPPGSRRGRGSGRGGPGRGLTRKGPEVRVRSTSPSSVVCAGLLGAERDRGRSSVRRASFEVEHAAPRRFRYAG
jgi:hypothetical protein